MALDAQDIMRLAVHAADDRKAMEITILNVGQVSVIADYFVICSGRSSVHAQAIATAVEEQLKKEEILKHRMEGYGAGEWILMDYGSVVVHVFQSEQRLFYNLEHLWGDAPVVDVSINL